MKEKHSTNYKYPAYIALDIKVYNSKGRGKKRSSTFHSFDQEILTPIEWQSSRN